MSPIYRKTTKGLAEIDTRAHRLSPRLRSLLILVDGRRDSEQIAALVAQPSDDALQALADGGFIEAAGEGAWLRRPPDGATPAPAPRSGAAAALPTAAASRSASAPVRSPAGAAAGPVSAWPTTVSTRPGDLNSDAFRLTRAGAVRALNDALGPPAEGLALRMEKTRNAAELQPLLLQAARLIAEARGRSAGEAYAARFLG